MGLVRGAAAGASSVAPRADTGTMVTTELLLPRVWELSSQPVITVTSPVLLPSHLRTVAHVTAATIRYLRLDTEIRYGEEKC